MGASQPGTNCMIGPVFVDTNVLVYLPCCTLPSWRPRRDVSARLSRPATFNTALPLPNPILEKRTRRKRERESTMKQIRTFEKDGHIIHWGDAVTTLENRIRDQSVDLIFADPPYSIGKRFADSYDKWPSEVDYVKWCETWLELCLAKLKPNGSLYVMNSTQHIPYIDLFLRQRIHIASRIVWYYDSSGVQAKKHFGSTYEPILFCVKDKHNYTFNSDDINVEARTGAQRRLIDYRKTTPTPYNTTKTPGNVWYFARVRYRMREYEHHPTQKPESLLERVVLASSNPGDIVLDPFAGTFTTPAVAQRFGRRSISIELAKDYVKIGLRRCAIQDSLDGERLRTVTKTVQRRNANGIHGGAVASHPTNGKLYF